MILLWLIGGVVGLIVAFFLLLTIVGLVERQYVAWFIADEATQPEAYMYEMVQEAAAFGFTWQGAGRHVVTKNARAVLMLSPDRSTLAQISQGKRAGMTLKKTHLFSVIAAGGTICLTVDESGTAETDPKTIRRILLNAEFAELWAVHQETIERLGPTKPFATNASWPAIDAINRGRIDRSAEVGLVRYVDAAHERFRFTPRGVWRSVLLNFFQQMLDANNQKRSNLSRPGDARR